MRIDALLNPVRGEERRMIISPDSSPPSFHAPHQSPLVLSASTISSSSTSVLPQSKQGITTLALDLARGSSQPLSSCSPVFTPAYTSVSIPTSATSGPPTSSSSSSFTTLASTITTPASIPRPRKDAAVFIHRPTDGLVKYPPYETIPGSSLLAEIQKFNVYPLGTIHRYPRRIPYKGLSNPKKSILRALGREAFEVFQYTFQVPGKDMTFVVLWDYNIGLVRVTPFFKALDHRKTVPGKALSAHADLADLSISITGGALAAQGYWLPYSAARELASTFCYHIRFALVPVFGYAFPEYCVRSSDPQFGVFRVKQETIMYCRAETERLREEREAHEGLPHALSLGTSQSNVLHSAVRPFSGPKPSLPYPTLPPYPTLASYPIRPSYPILPYPYPGFSHTHWQGHTSVPPPACNVSPRHYIPNQARDFPPPLSLHRSQPVTQPINSHCLPPPLPPAPPAHPSVNPSTDSTTFPTVTGWPPSPPQQGVKREYSMMYSGTSRIGVAPSPPLPSTSASHPGFVHTPSFSSSAPELARPGGRFAGFSFSSRIPDSRLIRRFSSDVSPRTVPVTSAGEDRPPSTNLYRRPLLSGGLSFVRGDTQGSDASRPLSHEEGARVLSELRGSWGEKRARRD